MVVRRMNMVDRTPKPRGRPPVEELEVIPKPRGRPPARGREVITKPRGRPPAGGREVIPKLRGRPPAGGREAIVASALRVIRESGIARLTAREVAGLAGVSEASVFYHYKDRFGLLQAVFEEGLRPLHQLAERGISAGEDPRGVLTRYGHTLETFLEQALPVIAAAQSDSELRNAMAAYMTEHDLGPHRGVRAIGSYFAAEQAGGRARADVDPYAAAMMFIGACYARSSQRQMPLPSVDLPPLDDIIDATVALMRPA
jgi:AcrR family transcriptional regulator